jgi:hypothetical protein
MVHLFPLRPRFRPRNPSVRASAPATPRVHLRCISFLPLGPVSSFFFFLFKTLRIRRRCPVDLAAPILSLPPSAPRRPSVRCPPHPPPSRPPLALQVFRLSSPHAAPRHLHHRHAVPLKSTSSRSRSTASSAHPSPCSPDPRTRIPHRRAPPWRQWRRVRPRARVLIRQIRGPEFPTVRHRMASAAAVTVAVGDRRAPQWLVVTK